MNWLAATCPAPLAEAALSECSSSNNYGQIGHYAQANLWLRSGRLIDDLLCAAKVKLLPSRASTRNSTLVSFHSVGLKVGGKTVRWTPAANWAAAAASSSLFVSTLQGRRLSCGLCWAREANAWPGVGDSSRQVDNLGNITVCLASLLVPFWWLYTNERDFLEILSTVRLASLAGANMSASWRVLLNASLLERTRTSSSW